MPKVIANVARHVLQSRLKLTVDIPAALTFLQTMDATLPDLEVAWQDFQAANP